MLCTPPMDDLLTTTRHVPTTLNEVMPQIYAELHKVATAYMRRERDGHTLQPTALINEAYIRLLSQHSVDFANRAHVLGVAAQMMRRILATHAEKKATDKRGGEFTHVCLSDSPEPRAATDIAFCDVDEALKRLAAIDERQSTVVELRILGGMSADEIAAFLNVSVATVHRDWSSGRLWLTRELRSAGAR
jgi:RNA polymerase sigma-70 factor (ECF subfamily)